ncbi:uncharacterized protein LOC122075182 [Macadamia integrifolia]|uniref:uncharacterized protein LOC122075182 n=1 Tax=Macadamia integrifolia TaxID=60698 RepID=UPI001C4F9F4C|nr:uncharacterized protein LOC122075182 [Macadamia integrifolia]
MDALQQHHRFMRAPPPPPPPPQQQTPPMADPQLRPSPPQGTWYSSQFQYHTSQVLPPPPQQTPWVTHSDHHHIPSAYPLQPHQHAGPGYLSAHPHNNQYLPPPPRSHLPPPPPPSHLPHSYPNASQVPQSYPPSNQTWGNTSWAHHQGWEYSDSNIPHSNEQDWAAKAREWAAAKAAMENQHSQSQFPPSGRLEEHNNVYHDQYQPTVDPHYMEMQQSSLPAWSHQQFPVSGTNLHRSPVNHLQESTSFGSGQPSYVSDGHISYTTRDGALLSDSDPVFSHQGSAPTGSSIYQQEVPSSYSSVQGKEETAEQIEQVYQQSPLPKSSAHEGQHRLQPILPAIGRSSSAEHPNFTYENEITDATADPSDLPLDFAPRFTRENDQHPQAGYTHPDPAGHLGSVDPIAAVPSIHAWTLPAATGVAYPPVPSGAQFEPSFVAPSVTGHSAPIFGRIPGPSFRPPISTVGTPFGLGAGAAVHPTRAFPGDANGVLNVSERPKKASVPNWLREEIIKKAVIPSSVQEHPEEDSFQSVGDESVDRSYKKGDQADNRSVDSSRSTEDEDDDEDDVEAARTAAINQEIKRVLTEVLLKVTDELFDEIATKVLSEDDLSVEVDHGYSPQNHKVLASSPVVPSLKASAKGLVPVKTKVAEADDVSGKSISSSPADVLGLASYASDDDDDDENRGSIVPYSKQTDSRLQLTNGKFADDVPDSVKNGSSKIEGPIEGRANVESDKNGTRRHGAIENGLGEGLDHENDETSALRVVGEDKINADAEKMVHSDAFESKNAVGEGETIKPELLPGNTKFKKSVPDDSNGGETRKKSDKNGHDGGSVGKDFGKEGETNKTRTHERHPDYANSKRRDERHARKEKADDRSALKERVEDRGAKSDKKTKESDLRKSSSHVDSKDDRKETEKTKRPSGKEDNNRKRERARDERGDRSRLKSERDSGRHKKQRSSSVSSRGRNSKDNSAGARCSDSSDEVSEGSGQRKMHTKRRSLSPSPTRSRRRQVSRSPHSKHSQRRHSPYSSLEITRYAAKQSSFRLYCKSFEAYTCIITVNTSGEEHKSSGYMMEICFVETSFSFYCRGKRSRSNSPVRRRRVSTLNENCQHGLQFLPAHCDCLRRLVALRLLMLYFSFFWNLAFASTMKASSLRYNKAFQVGLWLVWLSGFLLIALSLFAIQRLPSLRDQITKPKLYRKGLRDVTGPSITIFSAPSPFIGGVGARQVLAVRSWLALSPHVTVVLFGRDPFLVSLAATLGSRASVEPNIDFTFLGTPFFHSMLSRSMVSTSNISVLIDPEIVLLPDFISTLNYAYKLDHDWLLVAASPNVSHFMFQLEEAGRHWLKDGERIKLQKLQEFLAEKREWSCGGRMLMAWNAGEQPLHAGVLPPFLYGKGLHYQWVINEALSSDFRFVFDASEAISSFYPADLENWPNKFPRGFNVADIQDRSWEISVNSYLGRRYGSLYFHGANISKNLVKVVKCDRHYIYFDTVENAVYSFGEHSSLSVLKGRISRSRREKKCIESLKCVDCSKPPHRITDCSFMELFKLSTPLFLPFSLESLLSIIADKDKTVVLAVAGNSYRDMLMSWVCRLRQLLITNFVVCALDQETYQFSILQGLPVFNDPLAPINISFNDCHFGTKCFQRVSKAKSRLVLQILKLGYSVLLSDVDVYWFKNPLPFVRSFGPAVLVAQSDEFNETGPINLPRRLNSGFYFAHSDSMTIAAMEKVVKHASTSVLSEQPSFYDVLCGEGGSNRIGDDRCLEPETNLTVHFLDRNFFPNGAYHGLWRKKNVKASCMKKGCVTLHNNWISGRIKKLERQVQSGLWEYDSSTRMCLHGWDRSQTKSRRRKKPKGSL